MVIGTEACEIKNKEKTLDRLLQTVMGFSLFLHPGPRPKCEGTHNARKRVSLLFDLRSKPNRTKSEHFPCSSAFRPLTRSRFSTLLRSRPRSHFLNIFSRGEIFPPGMKIYYYLITGMESDSGLHGKGPRKALVRSLGGQGGCGEQRVLSACRFRARL